MLAIAPTNASAVALSGTVYCGFASGLGAGFSIYKDGSCMIPTQNVTLGQTYVVLTTGPSVSDASVLAGYVIPHFSSNKSVILTWFFVLKRPAIINLGALISNTTGSSNATIVNIPGAGATGTAAGTGTAGAAGASATAARSSASTLQAGALLATVAAAFAFLL
jgi:hypothetical protein